MFMSDLVECLDIEPPPPPLRRRVVLKLDYVFQQDETSIDELSQDAWGNGDVMGYLRVSPIRIAQHFPFMETR